MLQTLLVFSLVFFAQTADITITSPQPGDILRGQVDIVGDLNVPNFASAELAFSYAIPVGDVSNPADPFGWFTIQTFPQPVSIPTLATWDTTTLTDGDYILHLRVFFQDGSSQDVVVSDLKIRNDAPLPTATPTATLFPQSINPLPLSASNVAQPATPLISFPSATPLPANPASVTASSIYATFARGGVITLVLFVIFSLLLRLRKN